LQTLALGLLILAPLFRTYAVPALVEISQLLAPPSGAPPRPPEPPTTPTNVVHASELSGNAVMMPVRIPQRPAIIHDDQNSPAPLANGVFVADAIPGTEPRNSIVSDLVAHAPVPQPRPAAPSRARLSEGVSQGYLARRVEPAYPPLAIAARVQGAVILLAVIQPQW
jgi:protein TonB